MNKLLTEEEDYVGNLEGRGYIVRIKGSFSGCLERLYSIEGELLPAKEWIDSVNPTDYHSHTSKYGNYVREGVLYLPKQKHRRVVIRESPLCNIELAGKAEDENSEGREFFIEWNDAQKYIKLAEKGDSSVFPLENIADIERSALENNNFGRWLFQESILNYKEILLNYKKEKTTLGFHTDEYIDSQEKPFLTQIKISPLIISYEIIYGSPEIHANNKHLYTLTFIHGLIPYSKKAEDRLIRKIKEVRNDNPLKAERLTDVLRESRKDR